MVYQLQTLRSLVSLGNRVRPLIQLGKIPQRHVKKWPVGKNPVQGVDFSVLRLSVLGGASLISERFQGKPKRLPYFQMIKVPHTGIQLPDLCDCGWVVLPHHRGAKLA